MWNGILRALALAILACYYLLHNESICSSCFYPLDLILLRGIRIISKEGKSFQMQEVEKETAIVQLFSVPTLVRKYGQASSIQIVSKLPTPI